MPTPRRASVGEEPTRRGRRLEDHDGGRPTEGAPLQHERTMARVSRRNRDGELLDGWCESLCIEGSAAEVGRRVVFRPPLSDLLVHDELRAVLARNGPEGVGTLRETKARQRNGRRRGELRRGVRA